MTNLGNGFGEQLSWSRFGDQLWGAGNFGEQLSGAALENSFGATALQRNALGNRFEA